ncbi:MAG: hypothetical protein M3342_08910 [Bacteroidota bacterium]|nr:hypothetical protein [Bacteroidota bacterium]
MATKGQLLDMTPVGMKFTVLQASAGTGGRSLDLYWELLPGCNMKDPLVHTHPHVIETYEVLDGEMEFFVKDKWLTAKKGITLQFKKGLHMRLEIQQGKSLRFTTRISLRLKWRTISKMYARCWAS